jgi:hypothetical protein
MKQAGKKILSTAVMLLLSVTLVWAGNWEKQGDYYFLTKNNRDNFSLTGAGPNKFAHKYLKYDGINFLVAGARDWKDYGRLNLAANNIFTIPIRPGMKVDEVHFLAGGNYGNSYEHDALMRLYGEKYFYGEIIVIFAYQDGVYKKIPVPVFWDWFHIGPGAWNENGGWIRSLGESPVRHDKNIFHICFTNPRPDEPVRDILVSDSWVGDLPFSDVFAVTLKSTDTLDAAPIEVN